jgi:hypothetical protein
MDYCEKIWVEHGEIKITAQDQNHCRQILSQTSPSLIRILQAFRFIPWGYNISHVLFRIHFPLDFSWDELRMVISALRSLIGKEGAALIRKLLIVALDPTCVPVPFDSIMWDSACGSLRVMQQILRGEVDNLIM